MKKTILIISCVFLLASCATTHMTKMDKAPGLTTDPNNAMLVIIRETYFGGGIVFWNYLDSKMIGETKGKTYFITSVIPGPHYVVVATENTCVAHFDFKAGKTYFLGEGVTMGVWRARTSGFYPMTPEAAQDSMKNCSYLEYNPQTGGEDMAPDLYKKAIDDYQKDIKENPDAYKDILEYDGIFLQ